MSVRVIDNEIPRDICVTAACIFAASRVYRHVHLTILTVGQPRGYILLRCRWKSRGWANTRGRIAAALLPPRCASITTTPGEIEGDFGPSIFGSWLCCVPAPGKLVWRECLRRKSRFASSVCWLYYFAGWFGRDARANWVADEISRLPFDKFQSCLEIWVTVVRNFSMKWMIGWQYFILWWIYDVDLREWWSESWPSGSIRLQGMCGWGLMARSHVAIE